MEIFIAIVVIFFGYIIYKNIQADNNWKSWPTLEEYWQQHPNSKTQHGTRCYKCNSNYIRHYGWAEKSDNRRIHKCNQYGAFLYRRFD